MRIFISAHEPSADTLGAEIIGEVMRANPRVQFTGFGGPKMSAKGLHPLLPFGPLAIMGLVEIVRHLPVVLKYKKAALSTILETAPDLILTIDAPGFHQNLIKSLKRLSLCPPCHHVGAPTVWAWKPSRAAAWAKIFDHLYCLFPFEPRFFPDLPTTFVGHPFSSIPFVTERDHEEILLLPGSRVEELKKHVPLFLEAQKLLLHNNPDLKFTWLTLPSFRDSLRKKVGPAQTVTTNQTVFNTAGSALAVSGTVTLELAAHGIPHIITYRAHPLTALLARRLIKIPYVGLSNLLPYFMGGRATVPELLQELAHPVFLSNALHTLAREHQLKEFSHIHSWLDNKGFSWAQALLK